MSCDDITELGAVLIGGAHGRRRAADLAPGLAIQDLGIAKAAYTKAHELALQQVEL